MGRSRLLAVVIGGIVFGQAVELLAQGPAQLPTIPVTNLAATDRSLIRFLFEERGSERLMETLSQPASLDVKDKPLADVLRQVAKDAGINLVIDEAALAEDSIPTDTTISLRLSEVPRRQILTELLQPLKLGFIYHGKVLKVTTSTRCRDLLTLRGYDVREISNPNESEVEDLIDLIQEIVRPETWAQAGGTGTIRWANNFRMVLARQSEAGHENILNLLNELRKVRRTMSSVHLAIGEDAAERSLWKKVSVNWKRVPAREAFLKLAEQIGVTIQIDEVSLKKRDTLLDTPVTLSLEEIPAGQLFDAICRAVPEVYFQFDKQILVVTDRELTSAHYELRMYDISDLTKATSEGKRNADDVVDLVKRRCNLGARENSGSAAVTLSRLGDRQLLAMTHTQRTHREISMFLRDLRERFSQKDAIKKPVLEAAAIEVDSDPQVGREPDPDAPITPQVENLTASNTEFAFDLYRKVVKPNENLVISPLGVSSGFALLQPATRGSTAKELYDTFRFKLSESELHPAFAVILDRFRRPGSDAVMGNPRKNTLHLSSRLWCDQQGGEFSPDYLKLMREHYGMEPQRIKFQDLETARASINEWVSKRTSQQIPELIKPNILRRDAGSFVMTSAVVLEASWGFPFGVGNQGIFKAFDGKRLVNFLPEEAGNYAEVEDLQVLQKDYLGERLSMMLLLPKSRTAEGFALVEASLSAKRLQELKSLLKRQPVTVKVPKFHLHSQLRLKEPLQAMGLKRIWDVDTADLSGMSPARRFLDFSIQECDFQVDQFGTKPAPAWAGGGMMNVEVEEPPNFIADHPFLFLVQDNRTGSVLLLGRVMKP